MHCSLLAVWSVAVALPQDDGENAAPLYELAVAGYEQPTDDVRDSMDTVLARGWDAQYPALALHLERNASALATLRKAARLPRAEFPVDERVEEGLAYRMPALRETYSLVNTLLLEGKWFESRDEHAAALDTYLLVLRMGHHYGQDPGVTLIPKAMESGFQGLAIRHVQRLLQSPLGADEWRRALEELDTLERGRVGLDVVFENDGRITLALLEAALRSELVDPTASLDALRRVHAEYNGLLIEAYRGVSTEEYDRRMRALEEETANAGDASLALGDSAELRRIQEESPDLIAKMLIQIGMPSSRSITHFYTHRAKMDMLAMVIATHVYALERGTLPEDAERLVPDFRPSIPPDPFARGEPLRYLCRGNRWWFYSVGPDGVDHGGEREDDIRSLPRPD